MAKYSPMPNRHLKATLAKASVTQGLVQVHHEISHPNVIKGT